MDRQEIVRSLFGVPRALIGMIHAGALPGSPASALDLTALIDHAVEEAVLLSDAGFHGVILENMHDRPYLGGSAPPETVAAMVAIGREVRRACALPLGIQVLAAANREALAVALATGACFIRAEAFVYAHVADEGLLQAGAGELLRYRRAIGGGTIRVFADIKKKHSSHALTADVGLVETARSAEFFLADGVIVTGATTGSETDPREVSAVNEAVGVPTLVGSGVTPGNVGRFPHADGFIVGSYLKRDGLWSNAMERARVAAMAEAFDVMVRP